MEKLSNGSERDESSSSLKYQSAGSEIEIFKLLCLNPQVSLQTINSLEIHMNKGVCAKVLTILYLFFRLVTFK